MKPIYQNRLVGVNFHNSHYQIHTKYLEKRHWMNFETNLFAPIPPIRFVFSILKKSPDRIFIFWKYNRFISAPIHLHQFSWLDSCSARWGNAVSEFSNKSNKISITKPVWWRQFSWPDSYLAYWKKSVSKLTKKSDEIIKPVGVNSENQIRIKRRWKNFQKNSKKMNFYSKTGSFSSIFPIRFLSTILKKQVNYKKKIE